MSNVRNQSAFSLNIMFDSVALSLLLRVINYKIRYVWIIYLSFLRRCTTCSYSLPTVTHFRKQCPHPKSAPLSRHLSYIINDLSLQTQPRNLRSISTVRIGVAPPVEVEEHHLCTTRPLRDLRTMVGNTGIVRSLQPLQLEGSQYYQALQLVQRTQVHHGQWEMLASSKFRICFLCPFSFYGTMDNHSSQEV